MYDSSNPFTKTSKLMSVEPHAQRIPIKSLSRVIPSHCVVWVYFDKKTLELGPFLFFGGAAGLPLSSIEAFKAAKHTKGDAKGVKAKRLEIKEIPKGKFKKYTTVREVYDLLFKVVK